MLTLFVLSFCAVGQVDDAARGTKLLTDAITAVEAGLRSGTGVGTVEVFSRPKDQDKDELIENAKVKVYFDGKKYHVRLDYEKSADSHSRKIAVSHGDFVAVSRFSPRINPTGSEGEIHQPNPRGEPKRVGFPWNVAAFATESFDIRRLKKYHAPGPAAFKWTELPDGVLEGRCNVKTVTVKFRIGPASGYNCFWYGVFNPGDIVPTQESKLTWESKDGLWFVTAATHTTDSRRLDGSYRRWELRYTSFEPNAKVDPAVFDIDALELVNGSRIIDRRPEKAKAPLTERIRRYEKVN